MLKECRRERIWNRALGEDRGAILNLRAAVVLKNITKAFGNVRVLAGVNLTVREGEFVSLLGPSGSGKTTVLNTIAGFIEPDFGTIEIFGRSSNGVPPNRRGLGMVFQRYSLFPHMTVFDNIAFGLRVRGVPGQKTRGLVQEALDLVRLPDIEKRYPAQLSGGQQQRVALARALVVRPHVLLLDEPLSNLDAKLRKEMQVELRRVHNEAHLTSIYVTHDQEEALAISDRIVVLSGGVIVQEGTPEEVYDRPDTPFVAGFVGSSILLDGEVLETDGRSWIVKVDDFLLNLTGSSVNLDAVRGDRVLVCIKEEKVRILVDPASSPRSNFIRCKFKGSIYLGSSRRCLFETASGRRLSALADVTVTLQSGREVLLAFPPEDIVLLKAESN